MKYKNIAIIGAGLGGLTLGNLLKPHAKKITIFEKARGVSGRMSTRYAGDYNFDHGAQFFTVKTEAFSDFIQPMIDQEIIQPWKARFVEFEYTQKTWETLWSEESPHYVGCPNMNAVAKYLAQDLDIHLGTKIVKIQGNEKKWDLLDEKGETHKEYDLVLFAIPIEQIYDLLPPLASFTQEIQNIKMTGCYSLMVGFETSFDLGFDVALVREADISWVSMNHSKPQRNAFMAMVILATNKWAERHMEMDQEIVKQYLLHEASTVIGYDLQKAEHQTLHRWRYANSPKQKLNYPFFDENMGIGVTGDWCIQGRVESAFTAAKSLCCSINK